MKKHLAKKLKLHRETVRQLQAPALARVAGGTETNTEYCGPTLDDCTGLTRYCGTWEMYSGCAMNC